MPRLRLSSFRLIHPTRRLRIRRFPRPQKELIDRRRTHQGFSPIPNVSRFGEKSKVTDAQGYEDVTPGSPGKEYRLLKVVTQPATADQLARLGNDRAPVVIPLDSTA